MKEEYIKWCRMSEHPLLALAYSTAGLLDVHLPVSRFGLHGLWVLFLEPSALSEEQDEYIEKLIGESHLVYVLNSVQEAIDVTLDYLTLDMEK